MAIIKDRGYLYGSTAPLISEPKRQESDWIKREQEHQRKQLKKTNKAKLQVYASILTVGILFGFTLVRSTELYQTQKTYNTLITDTRVLHKSNEGLRADIIKLSAIDNIVAKADELNLTLIPHDEFIEVDLNKNNFSEPVEEVQDKSIFQKLFSQVLSVVGI